MHKGVFLSSLILIAKSRFERPPQSNLQTGSDRMLRNTENYLVWEEKIQSDSRDSESCCYFFCVRTYFWLIHWKFHARYSGEQGCKMSQVNVFYHWFTFYNSRANMSYEYWFHTWFQVKYQYLDILYPRGNLGGISTRKTWGMTDAIYLLKCEVSHI